MLKKNTIVLGLLACLFLSSCFSSQNNQTSSNPIKDSDSETHKNRDNQAQNVNAENSPSNPFFPASQNLVSSRISPCEGRQARNFGDPHIVTFDGYQYSFHSVGEFILVKATDHQNNPIEIQTRQKAWPGQSVSLVTAVAMKVGSDTVAFYAQDFPDSNDSTPLRIGQEAKTISEGQPYTLPGGGSISYVNSRYVIDWPNKDFQTIVSIGQTPTSQNREFKFLNISPRICSGNRVFVGLLGNADGKNDNELQTRDGKELPQGQMYDDIVKFALASDNKSRKLAGNSSHFYEKLYNEFGNDWRVNISRGDEVLFTYPKGLNSESFTNRNFPLPTEYNPLASVPPAKLREAKKFCFESEVQFQLLGPCLMDIALTDQTEFARVAANARLTSR